MTRGLMHLNLDVADLEWSVSFYREVYRAIVLSACLSTLYMGVSGRSASDRTAR